MDKSFELFLDDEGFAPAFGCRPVPETTFDKYQGRLPNKLLEYWREFGFCGYGEGLFWIVDPGKFEDVVESWLEGTSLAGSDNYHVFARTAFGKLYLWGEKGGRTLDIQSNYGMLYPTPPDGDGLFDLEIRAFFSGQSKDDCDFYDSNDKPLFKRALKKLGCLEPDELYGFEPALALGGVERLENLVKVKAVEHLLILAQLGEKEIRENEAIKALREGRITP